MESRVKRREECREEYSGEKTRVESVTKTVVKKRDDSSGEIIDKRGSELQTACPNNGNTHDRLAL